MSTHVIDAPQAATAESRPPLVGGGGPTEAGGGGDVTARMRELWDAAVVAGRPLPSGGELARATGGSGSLGRRNARRWREELAATGASPVDHASEADSDTGTDEVAEAAKPVQVPPTAPVATPEPSANERVVSTSVVPAEPESQPAVVRQSTGQGRADAWTTVGIYVVGVAAALTSWTGWTGLAALCSWSQYVSVQGVRLQAAWLLPIAVDVYAIVAARVWIRMPWISAGTRTFAARSTVTTIVLGVAANVIFHYMDTNALNAHWLLVSAMAAVPPLMLAAVAHLSALLTRDRTRGGER